MLQVCLNGARRRADCPGLPVTAAELAVAARAAVDAGAEDIHLHPKDSHGRDTLNAAAVAQVLDAVRTAVPGIPVGVTTGAWAEPDPHRRAEAVRAWTVLPDHASVNWHEPGADLVAAALLDMGVAIEAGLYSGTDGPDHFRRSPHAPHVLRILAEVVDTDPATAEPAARALLAQLGADLPAPVLLHGENESAWPVLRLAARLNLDTRIGLEDVLHDEDGKPVQDNATLVQAARAVITTHT
ncbi:3-keto-5-aminohexanoate cleavage protein [Nocardia blacklockiae]|uniref:3-keto-5-aminohexanoate cleavage protein n=1 Tax=Nocardia blacklockiae TaxID=480036 RepID=UPI001893A971|nr:3-keto-5-aminohexanoate cleavage protein [Nocardia blacklockiae]MBF6170790.1 3-keto-5-aminohexanoate cleavage protein [Nocardia blacklockiae]